MVGPTTSGQERTRYRRGLGAGFVLVVAVSGAFTGIWAGAGPVWVAGFAVAGAALGTVLVLYLSWLGREARLKATESTRSRRPSPNFGSEDEETREDSEADRRKQPKRR